MKQVNLNDLFFHLLGFYDDPEDLRRLGEHCLSRYEEMVERLAAEQLAEKTAEERAAMLDDKLYRYSDFKAGNAFEVHR